MNLSDEVDLEDFVARPDKISGADINSICQEVWSRRLQITFLINYHAKDLFKIDFSDLNKQWFRSYGILRLVWFQAGMQAVRENRYVVLPKDFEKAYKNVIKKDEQECDFYK